MPCAHESKEEDPLKNSGSFLCFRVFVAKKTIGGFVLINFGESSNGRKKPIVAVVVVALADLAEQYGTCAGFDLKIVVEPLGNKEAFTGAKADLGAGGNGQFKTVFMNGDIRFVINLLVGEGIIDTD